MTRQIFYDPQRKRWPWLRRLFNGLGLAISLLIALFIVRFFQASSMPHLLMPEQKRILKTLKEKELRKKKVVEGTHRKTTARPSDVVLNTDEGIRAAYT